MTLKLCGSVGGSERDSSILEMNGAIARHEYSLIHISSSIDNETIPSGRQPEYPNNTTVWVGNTSAVAGRTDRLKWFVGLHWSLLFSTEIGLT